jgi:hypothetical protein
LAAASPLLAQTQSLAPGQFFLLAEQARTAFTIEGAGARAAGTGGAFIAVADDATAVSFNPAGLGQLQRPEVSLVGQWTSRNLDLTGFQGQNAGQNATFSDTWSHNTSVRPTFASLAIPWQSGGLNRTFLISYQRLFDFTNSVDDGYQGLASGGSATQSVSQQFSQNGGMDLYSAGLGAELSARILLGASVNYWTGHSSFSSNSAAQTSGVGVPFYSVLSQDTQFRGFNFNLGLIWRSRWLNLGLVYRTPYTANYLFSNNYTYVSNSNFMPTTQSGPRTQADVRWPETIGWGFGLHPGSRLLVTADCSRTPWSRAHLVAPGTPYDGLNWFDYQNPTGTRDTTDYHAGAEWLAVVRDNLVLPIRAGWFREPQPVVDPQTGSQRVLQGWTLGSGVKFRNLTFDLAYKEAHDVRYVSRFDTDSPVGGFSATALGYEHLLERSLYASVIWQLDEGWVHRALSWTFLGGGPPS